jgi:hypothetical protein
MDQYQIQQFKRTVFVIKGITLIIAIMVFIVSRYAFLFFLASMLPTMVTIALDKKDNRSLSAVICTFNLMGVMPYLSEMWHSANVNVVAKWMIGDFSTWLTVYFIAFIGQLLVWFLPGLVSILYKAKSKLQVESLEQQRKVIQDEWDIRIFDNDSKQKPII